MKNKILTMVPVVCIVLMLFAVLPILAETSNVSAEITTLSTTGTCGDGVSWMYDNETRTLTISGEGEITDTSFKEYSYFGGVDKLIISEGVTAIADSVFCDCTIPVIFLPDTLEEIGDYAFYRCDMFSLMIPDGVKTIGDFAFAQNSILKSVAIPSSVEYIGEGAFDGISGNVTIYYLGSENDWSNIFICDWNDGLDDIIFCDKVCDVYDDVTWELDYDGTLVISGTGEVAPSGMFEFAGFMLYVKKIIFDEGITALHGDGTFGLCHFVESVAIPKSVLYIDSNSFDGCEYFTDIYYAETEKEWNNIDIYDTSTYFSNVTIHYNNTDGGVCSPDGNVKWSFNKISGKLTIDGKGEMYDYTADAPPWWENYGERITAIHIGKDVENIGYLFPGMLGWAHPNLTSFTVDEDNLYYSAEDGVLFDAEKQCLLKYNIFKDDTRTEYNIPEGVQCVADDAFYKCNSLTSITYPESVTNINFYAFRTCENLTSITIPQSVIDLVFVDCSLRDIYYLGTEAEWNEKFWWREETLDWLCDCGIKVHCLFVARMEYSISGRIIVTSAEDATLYIADYADGKINSVKTYDVTANAEAVGYDFVSGQKAFIFDADMIPLCEAFSL